MSDIVKVRMYVCECVFFYAWYCPEGASEVHELVHVCVRVCICVFQTSLC